MRLRWARSAFLTNCWVIVDPPCVAPQCEDVLEHGAADALVVDAAVLVEALVLDRDRGLLHHRGDVRRADQDPPLVVGQGGDLLAVDVVDDRVLGVLELGAALELGQVARDRHHDPEDPGDEGEHREAQEDEREAQLLELRAPAGRLRRGRRGRRGRGRLAAVGTLAVGPLSVDAGGPWARRPGAGRAARVPPSGERRRGRLILGGIWSRCGGGHLGEAARRRANAAEGSAQINDHPRRRAQDAGPAAPARQSSIGPVTDSAAASAGAAPDSRAPSRPCPRAVWPSSSRRAGRCG